MWDGDCKVCGRHVSAGVFLVNSCRAFMALDLVKANPGLTSAELANETGETYADVSIGLTQARANKWVTSVSEEREQGGKRYRHWPLDDSGRVDNAKREHRATVQTVVGAGR